MINVQSIKKAATLQRSEWQLSFENRFCFLLNMDRNSRGNQAAPIRVGRIHSLHLQLPAGQQGQKLIVLRLGKIHKACVIHSQRHSALLCRKIQDLPTGEGSGIRWPDVMRNTALILNASSAGLKGFVT